MTHKQIVKTWTRFKQIMTDLTSAGLPYTLYQVDECTCYYHLLLVNDITFSIQIEKGTADATDYENNFKTGKIVCNAFDDD